MSCCADEHTADRLRALAEEASDAFAEVSIGGVARVRLVDLRLAGAYVGAVELRQGALLWPQPRPEIRPVARNAPLPLLVADRRLLQLAHHLRAAKLYSIYYGAVMYPYEFDSCSLQTSASVFTTVSKFHQCHDSKIARPLRTDVMWHRRLDEEHIN